jgi:hypothetical protein
MRSSLAIIAVLNLNHQRTAGDAKSESGSRNLLPPLSASTWLCAETNASPTAPELLCSGFRLVWAFALRERPEVG